MDLDPLFKQRFGDDEPEVLGSGWWSGGRTPTGSLRTRFRRVTWTRRYGPSCFGPKS